MTVESSLIAIEETLWTGGPDAYREHVAEECLLAFTGMAGVKTREEIAGSVAGGPRWRDLKMDLKGVVRPEEDVALLTYEASAVRGDSESYHALVSSAYTRKDGAWKLVFHQQTPLEGP